MQQNYIDEKIKTNISNELTNSTLLKEYYKKREWDGALSYYTHSKINNIDLFVEPKRAEIIAKILIQEQRQDYKIFLGMIDKKAAEICKELNEAQESCIFKMKTPLLINWVFSEINSADDFIPRLIELRSEKTLKIFRDWRRDIKQDFEAGNVKMIRSYFLDLKNMIESLTKEKDSKFDISISLNPSVSIPISLKHKSRSQLAIFRDIFDSGIQHMDSYKKIKSIFDIKLL